jgi:ankyrin repeat protein
MFFFRKPKGWDDLPEAAQAWAKHLNKENISTHLKTCVESNHDKCIRFLIENGHRYGLTADDVKTALLTAVRRNSIASLKAILDTGNKENYLDRNEGYSTSWRAKESLLLDALETAAEAKAEDAWDALVAWNFGLNTAHRLRLRDNQIVRIAVKQKFGAALGEMLDETNANAPALFADALSIASDTSAEHVKFVLQFFEASPETHKTLNHALARAAAEGSKERVNLLLAKGANIDHGNGETLWLAVHNNRFEMIDHLLSRGADLAAYGDALLMKLREKNPQSPVMDYLDRIHQKALAQKEKRRLEQERFSLAGPETLAETLPLPSGGTLTLLFNFATRQQIIVVQENPAAKQKASFQVINFADIENHEAVERAGKKLIELGGDAKAVENAKLKKNIFPRNGNP